MRYGSLFSGIGGIDLGLDRAGMRSAPGRWRLMTTTPASSPSTGPTSPSSETYTTAAHTTWSQLTLLPVDFLASHSAWLGSDEARRMTVTSGRKCAVLCKSLSPVGCLVRMFLTSPDYISTQFRLTWKIWTTKSGRLVFRLQHSRPSTYATDSLFWPTPRASTGAQPKAGTVGPTGKTPDGKKRQVGLEYAVRMVERGVWPTPCAGDSKSRRTSERAKRIHSAGPTLTEVVWAAEGLTTGVLNPRWVEWLMGFPDGWTDLRDSATPSAPSSLSSSDG